MVKNRPISSKHGQKRAFITTGQITADKVQHLVKRCVIKIELKYETSQCCGDHHLLKLRPAKGRIQNQEGEGSCQQQSSVNTSFNRFKMLFISGLENSINLKSVI